MAADTVAAGVMFAFSDHFKNIVLLRTLILIDNSGGIRCHAKVRVAMPESTVISYEWGRSQVKKKPSFS